MNKQNDESLAGEVWKFGCNWKNCERSFYDFIKSKGIIFGIDKFKSDVGDLVLINEGFKVKAIAKVLEEPVSITTKPEYEALEKEFHIVYEDSTYYAKADWYELPKDKIFEYKLQRGGAKVRKPEIIKKAFELWNNRTSK